MTTTESRLRREGDSGGRRAGLTLLILSALLLGVVVLRCFASHHFKLTPPTGDLGDSLHRLIVAPLIGSDDASLTQSLLDLRLHRVAVGLIAGVALALAGVALQALLRNVLAEPFILGLSGGAALGVVAQKYVVMHFGLAVSAGHIGAMVGSLAIAAVVFALGRRRGIVDPVTLLLTGVVLSTLCGAGIMTVNYMHSSGGLVADLARWMMGYLNEDLSTAEVFVLALVTLAGFVWLWTRGRAMDVATFSEPEAVSLGVRVGLLRTTLFVVAAVLAAAAVVLAGPVAFVGLICPHLARLMLGPRHRLVIPAAALLGGTLVVGADTLTTMLDVGQGRMPIGIYTALLGGPAFLWMFRSEMGRGVGDG